MIVALISQALYLLLKLALIALGSVAVAALIMGILQVATQIQDAALGVFGRVIGCAVFFFLFGSSVGTQLVDYTKQLWSSAQYFK